MDVIYLFHEFNCVRVPFFGYNPKLFRQFIRNGAIWDNSQRVFTFKLSQVLKHSWDSLAPFFVRKQLNIDDKGEQFIKLTILNFFECPCFLEFPVIPFYEDSQIFHEDLQAIYEEPRAFYEKHGVLQENSQVHYEDYQMLQENTQATNLLTDTANIKEPLQEDAQAFYENSQAFQKAFQTHQEISQANQKKSQILQEDAQYINILPVISELTAPFYGASQTGCHKPISTDKTKPVISPSPFAFPHLSALPEKFNEHWQLKLETELRARKYSPQTRRAYLYYNRFICRTLQKTPEEILHDDVTSFLAWMEKTGEYSSAAMKLAISSIKFFFRNIMKKDHISDNHRPRKDNRLPVVLSKEEIMKMLEHEKNPKHRLLLM
jgi:hypothetical protein